MAKYLRTEVHMSTGYVVFTAALVTYSSEAATGESNSNTTESIEVKHG